MPPSRSRAACSDTQVRLFPRRKLSGGDVPEKGRAPLKVDIVAIKSLFGRPQSEAAGELGISLTALKQICRKLGVPRWPYQRPGKASARSGKFLGTASESLPAATQSASPTTDEAASDSEIAESCTSAADTEDESAAAAGMDQYEPAHMPVSADVADLDQAHREWMEEADLLKQLCASEASSHDAAQTCGDDLAWMIALPEHESFSALAQIHYDANWLSHYTEICISAEQQPRQYFDRCVERSEPTPLFSPLGGSDEAPLPFDGELSQQSTANNSPRSNRAAGVARA